MSLLRLLTAGKSLVGLRDYQSRYVTRGGMLPQFASKKNPFRATVKPDSRAVSEPSAVAPAGPAEPTCSPIESTEPVEVPKSQETPAALIPSEAVGANGQSATGTPAALKLLLPLAQTRRAVSRLDLSFDWSKVLFWRRPGPVRQAVIRSPKPLIQGELSLEGVKVVRNDLSDSDLEIVPVKSTPPTVAQAPANAVPPETTWDRVTGAFLARAKPK